MGANKADSSAAVESDELQEQSDNIKNLSEISKNSRTTFMAILLAGAYCYLTIGTTTDAALLSNNVASPLPIIQAKVPIVWFYYFAPLILFLLFVYFHLYLQRFWRCVAALPLRHKDGRTLDDYIYPWLISAAFLRAEIEELRGSQKFHIPLESAISILLAWWSIPLLLLFFWARYLSVHDWSGTILHMVLIVLSITGAIRFYYAAKISILANHPKSGLVNLHKYPNLITSIGAISSVVFLSFVSYGAIEGAPKEDCLASDLPQCSFMYSGARLLESIGYSPFANIEGHKLSKKPDNWSTLLASETAKEKIEEMTGPVLTNRDLRFTNGKLAFLTRSDFRESRMQRIKLDHAILVSSNLTRAILEGGTLKEANLKWADLTDAQLNNTDLTQANLQNSRLENANLRNSQLHGANLSHAIGFEVDFSDSDLRFANFTDADFPAAKLINAELQKANFTRAELESSNIDNVSLQFANLQESTFTSSVFQGADLRSANLVKAYIDESKFKEVNLDEADMRFVYAYKTTFTNSTFTEANLNNADLRESQFSNTDMTDAYLDGADLSNAIFDNTNFKRANFGKSELYDTVIKNSDLSGAILTHTKGFELAKLAGSCGDKNTRLPKPHRIPLCSDKIKTDKDKEVAQVETNAWKPNH